jgi:hypothetical protein
LTTSDSLRNLLLNTTGKESSMNRRSNWTQHKLNDGQLIRLSQLANGRPNNAGMAMVALVNKGLAINKGRGRAEVTEAGREALAQARKEGW